MNQKEQMIKKVIILLLTVVFLVSVFLIAAGKYGLWNLWFSDDGVEQKLEILSENSRWKHLMTREEPGVGNVWTTLDYNAESWETVAGEYNEDAGETGTTTAFFRYEFNLEDAGKYEFMEGHIQYADAVIIYLNGNIIFTGNVPDGGYYSNLDMGSSNDEITERESSFVVTDLAGLVNGKNVVAVEIHRKDEESRNINFHFRKLTMMEPEYEENMPNTQGMMLCKGEEEDAVEVDWITELHEAYKIEYMEGTLDTVKESTFSEYAKTVIMGNRELADNAVYRKTGQIRRLKERTNYVYRVMRIGGTKGSRLYQFRTAEKQKTSFLYTGITQTSSLSESRNLYSWKNRIKTAVNISDETDYLIVGKTDENQKNFSTDDFINNEIRFRTAPQLKEIPVIVSEVKLQQEKTDLQERKCRAYMDLLMISLDTCDKDYEGVREYVKGVMQKRNRKWNIVILSSSEAMTQDGIDENYMEIFKALDIDFVLVNGGTSYFNIFDEAIFKDADEREYVKKRGETLYTFGGTMAVAVHISTEEIEVKIYDTETKLQTNSIYLRKTE